MGSVVDHKPVFLVVTGAWHPPKCYDLLVKELAALDYECVVPQHPSMGHGAEGLTWKVDVKEIHKTAEVYFHQGREVILVAHSYGGIPACLAVEGWGLKERRKEDKPGGFRHIIFMAAFAIPARGMDLITTFGGTWPPWINTAVAYTKNHLTTLNNDLAVQTLYQECTPEQQEWARSMWLPHSQDAFETPCDFVAADITIPKTYLICEKDHAFPLFLQEQLVKAVPGMREARISADHSPFVGKPRELAETLVKII